MADSDSRETGADGQLVVHPERARLAGECDALRTGLVSLAVERDHLLQVTKPYLEALYLARLGDLKMELLELQVGNRRARSRLEMMRAAANRGRAPDMARIELALEAEFAEWTARLQRERVRVGSAIFSTSHLVDATDAEELRRLYKSLARQLHPDVNADKGPESAALWLAIQTAYSDGDLGGLQALAIVAEGQGGPPPLPGSLDSLCSRRDDLTKQVGVLTIKLAEIKATWPFTLTDNLGDDAWVDGQREELRRLIDGEKDVALRLLVATASLESEVRLGK